MSERTGAVISEQTFGETVADAYGVPFCLAADGKWYRADASDPLLSRGDMALCVEPSVAAGGIGSLLKYGWIRRTGWTWTLGQPVYFGATPGTLTQTKPVGNTIRYAGYPAAADALWFSPTDPVLAEFFSLELPPGTQGDLLYHNGTAWVPTDAGALRNWIINGNFAVNQRGAATKAQAAGVYGYDRWKGHASGIEQVVEALPAGEYTLSWEGGGTGYFAGTSGASPITKIVAGGNTSVVVPNDATVVTLNAGSVALPFSPRPIAEELALCQRYCLAIPATSAYTYMSELGWVADAEHSITPISTPVTMRVRPTVSFSGSLRAVTSISTTLPITALSVTTNQPGCLFLYSTHSTGTPGDISRITANNDATAKIILDAEL